MDKKSELAFEDHGRGLVFVARGVVSGRYLLKRNKKTYSTEVLEQLRYQIVDLRELDRLDISTEQMQELAAMDRRAAEQSPSPVPLRVAIVIAHDITEGLGRIYCAYAKSPALDAQVFFDMETARSWAQAAADASNQQMGLCF